MVTPVAMGAALAHNITVLRAATAPDTAEVKVVALAAAATDTEVKRTLAIIKVSEVVATVRALAVTRVAAAVPGPCGRLVPYFCS